MNLDYSRGSKLYLKPLNLADIKLAKDSPSETAPRQCECLLCSEASEITLDDQKSYLAHLLVAHQLVIADVNQIGHFEKYADYWRRRFKEKTITLKDVCYEIFTNTGAKDKGESERYFLLSDNLPEEKELRKTLNIHKLVFKWTLGDTSSRLDDLKAVMVVICVFRRELWSNKRRSVMIEAMWENVFFAAFQSATIGQIFSSICPSNTISTSDSPTIWSTSTSSMRKSKRDSTGDLNASEPSLLIRTTK